MALRRILLALALALGLLGGSAEAAPVPGRLPVLLRGGAANAGAPSVAVLPEARALAVAQRITQLPAREARLVVHAGARAARLAWYVAPRQPGIASAPVVVIDAETGAVLEARDRVRHARALVYPANPVTTPTVAFFPLPVAVITARSCVDLGGVTTLVLAGDPRSLRTCALASVAMPDGAGDYAASPRSSPRALRGDADPFAEASARWHAGATLDFVAGLAGGPLVPGPLDVLSDVRIADGLLAGDLERAGDPARDLTPFPQAFFVPGAGEGEGAAFRALYGITSGAVVLGQGAQVDFAYDGDVVAHETTHAVIDATLGLGGLRRRPEGLSDDPEALGEALADYVAAARSGDPTIGEYAALESKSTETLLRTLANDDGCALFDGEPHDDATAISGALWEVRAAAADPAEVDRAIVGALLPAAPTLGVEDFFARVRSRLATASATRLDAAVARRGLPCVAPIPLVLGATLRGTRRPFAAPGTRAAGVPLAPGLVQLAVPAPAGGGALRVTFTGQRVVASPLFGDPDASFRPRVLAAWDRPIRWTFEPVVAHDADAAVNADGAASFVATVRPAPGSRLAYLQIANEGDGDGLYDAITVEVDDAVHADAGTSATAGPRALAAGGSACASGAASSPPGAPRGLLALLGALLVVRLKRRAGDRRGDLPRGSSRARGSRHCSTQ